MMDGVQFQTRRAKGELSRNDIYFEEPWGTTEKEEDRVKGVPPPGFFGNGWKHPERPPRPVDYSNLPYGTRLTVESRPPPALKPNQERPKLEEVGVDPRFRLRSTAQAFNEVRPGENAGPFAPEAKKQYLAELKLQMDGQKANRRMEHLQHFGWDVGSKPIRGASSSRSLIRTAAARSTSWSCDRSCVTPRCARRSRCPATGRISSPRRRSTPSRRRWTRMATGRSRTTNLSRR